MLRGEEYLAYLGQCQVSALAQPDGLLRVVAVGYLQTPPIAPQEQPHVYRVLNLFLALHAANMLLRHFGVLPLRVGDCAALGRFSLAYPVAEVQVVAPVLSGSLGAPVQETLIQYHFRGSMLAARPASAPRTLSDYLRTIEQEKAP